MEERSVGQGTAMGCSPRRLSTHQQAVLIHVLLTFPDEPVAVCYVSAVADARDYAQDFATIFKALGWSVFDRGGIISPPQMTGTLAIALKNATLPSSAEALRDALRIYGIDAGILTNQSELCGAHKFVLVVGAR
jgi:hypothetical protein